MFYYFHGEVALLENGLAVIDCGGVGYACRTTSFTISKLRVGQTAKLFAFCNIRQDAFDLFGFSSREELRCFELLIGVTGVGPKAALAILSASTPERFTFAIMTQDEAAITMAPGVGKKLAQRIILELKDKLGSINETAGISIGQAPAAGSNLALAQAALMELGYHQNEISAALKDMDTAGMPTQEIVRQCLRAMVTR